MSSAASKRLLVVLVVFLAFLAYLGMRDTVRVRGRLPPKDVQAIVRGAAEWSTPKLFRYIEIEPRPGGLVWARVREPGGRWCVTVFTNHLGVWGKCGWYLLGPDQNKVRH